MKQGIFVMGKCVGFSVEPWARNGKSGTNYRVGISRVYQNRWGEEETDTVTVDVAQDGAEKIKKQCEMLKGQAVAIRVVPMAKAGGKTGAFYTLFAPTDSDLVPQSGLLVAAAAPAPKAVNQ